MGRGRLRGGLLSGATGIGRSWTPPPRLVLLTVSTLRREGGGGYWVLLRSVVVHQARYGRQKPMFTAQTVDPASADQMNVARSHTVHSDTRQAGAETKHGHWFHWPVLSSIHEAKPPLVSSYFPSAVLSAARSAQWCAVGCGPPLLGCDRPVPRLAGPCRPVSARPPGAAGPVRTAVYPACIQLSRIEPGRWPADRL